MHPPALSVARKKWHWVGFADQMSWEASGVCLSFYSSLGAKVCFKASSPPKVTPSHHFLLLAASTNLSLRPDVLCENRSLQAIHSLVPPPGPGEWRLPQEPSRGKSCIQFTTSYQVLSPDLWLAGFGPRPDSNRVNTIQVTWRDGASWSTGSPAM